MRSSFGRFAQELRLSKSMSQKDFSELSGMSLAHVSNLEHNRMNVSDDVVSVYIKILNCTGPEAHELRKRATFSNNIRKQPDPKAPDTPLRVMFEQFGERLSPAGLAEIQKILERETGERVETLRFSSNIAKKRTLGNARNKRPSLSPTRLVEIALIAETQREKICSETQKVDIGLALDKLCHLDARLDYEVRSTLPVHLEGAFAAIVGHADGHTIIVEERRYLSALKGVHFARHVLAHELGHHFLHEKFLQSDVELWMQPQELAKNSALTATSEKRIEQVVDSIEEVEAECFGTLFLVPWTAFLKGTANRYLASDYGEQQDEVERYARFFALDSVKNAFRACLWELGKRQHPIFKS